MWQKSITNYLKIKKIYYLDMFNKFSLKNMIFYSNRFDK